MTHHGDRSGGRDLAGVAETPALSRALCCALPLRSGDTLAIIGWPPTAATAARDFGVRTIVVGRPRGEHATDRDVVPAPISERLPLADSSVDHVMLQALTPATRDVVPRELTRVVRPGGTMFVVSRSRWVRPGGDSEPPSRWTDGHLRSAGLTDIRSYGVRPTLREARYLVPFDCRPALRWYARSFVSDATFSTPFLSSAMRAVPRAHALLAHFPTAALRVLFPAVALRAVRPESARPG